MYPNMKFMLEIESHTTILNLTSGDPRCSNVTVAGTTCNVALIKDSYSISVTLTNDLGSTMDSKTIESKCYCFIKLLLTKLDLQHVLLSKRPKILKMASH